MPERSHREIIATASSVADSLGDDYKFSRDPQVNAERAKRRRERRERAARAPRSTEWAKCIAPGCKFLTPAKLGNGIEFAICSIHAAAVWESVEEALNDQDPMMSQALDALRARREVIRSERRKLDEALKAAAAEDLNRPETLGEIYYVRANGLIKVGWSSDICRRLRDYGANAEILCHYPATRADETNLHRQLAPSRAKGREWYHDDPVVQAFIYRAVREHGPPTAKVRWTEPSKSKVRAKTWRG